MDQIERIEDDLVVAVGSSEAHRKGVAVAVEGRCTLALIQGVEGIGLLEDKNRFVVRMDRLVVRMMQNVWRAS